MRYDNDKDDEILCCVCGEECVVGYNDVAEIDGEYYCCLECLVKSLNGETL